MYPLKEYTDVLNLIDKDSVTRQDVYTELLKKEDKVLDVIARVANQDEIKRKGRLMEMSISEAIARFANTWKNIFVESIEAKSKDPRTYGNIITKDDRKVYVGVMLVVIAMFLFFISVTDM